MRGGEARVNRREDRYSVEEGSVNAWRAYSAAEDKERTNVHYERPPEFFTLITGGEWNVYSCNVWDASKTDTESQEQKLDLLARLMGLKAGQRVLDIGCGWGGPIAYLAKRYGVQARGLTLSEAQKEYADARLSQCSLEAAVHLCHWREYESEEKFDAVYTDEVIVHFNDLLAFFRKVRSLLKPGGVMLNKELHYASTSFMKLTRAMVFLNKIYGETGNYRPLHDELRLLDESGFALTAVHQIPISNYARTARAWLANMEAHRARLQELAGVDYYNRFRTYLRIVRRMTHLDPAPMTLDVVVARSPG